LYLTNRVPGTTTGGLQLRPDCSTASTATLPFGTARYNTDLSVGYSKDSLDKAGDLNGNSKAVGMSIVVIE